MSELRQNPVSKDWVLIAPNRAKRPDEFAVTHLIHETLPEIDPSCPFCPGKEGLNVEIARIPKGSKWNVRVIPNKFEALTHIPKSAKRDFYLHLSGSGDHEVVITRKHNEPIALQSVTTISLALRVLGQRLVALGMQKDLAYAHIFHNHGHDAGASISHPHYQILTTPIVPPMIHAELSGAYDYYRQNGRNIYEDIIYDERVQSERLILETENFVVLAPYASRHPFESMILPKSHSPRYENLTDKESQELAYVLKSIMEKLYVVLNDRAINFYVHTMPFERTKTLIHDESAHRWHISIFPRLTVWAGFEFGTGIPINLVAPEDAAKLLR